MKILLAPDSFKGTFSSEKVIELLTNSAKKHFKNCEIVGVPIADGGEGTLDSILKITKGKRKKLMVLGPLFTPVEASYGIIDENSVLIEMAQASGITLIPYKDGNAAITTTYGTGELINDALKSGYKNITIAIGGSATNDGGIGAIAALGARFLDEDGNALKPIGRNLAKIRKIDLHAMNPLIENVTFTVMCDVTNPLTGPKGATHVYGPQKGAVDEYLDILEDGMKNYASVIKKQLNIYIDQVPGAGAAGGLGAALMAFLNATLQSGIKTMLDLINFDTLLKDVDLIVTGEGKIDYQSSFGKVPSGIGHYARKHGIPVVAITGGMGQGSEEIYDHGIESIMVTTNAPMTLDEALEKSTQLFESAADRMFRFIALGMKL